MAVKNDLQNLTSMIKTMESQIQMLKDMDESTITIAYGLDISIKNTISKMSMEEIENLDEDSAIRILNDSNLNNVEAIKTSKETNDEYSDKPLLDYIKHVFVEIKKSSDEIQKLESEKASLIKNVDEISENYFNYINSEEYQQKKLEKLENLKKDSDNETDPIKKKAILKMIEGMENSETLDFLFKRLLENPEKEAKNIKDTYFNDRRSSLIMQKFSARLPRYGYNPNIYKMFFNLEEKFLDEKYHDLNNVFLFGVMRFISYSDTNNKNDNLYVSSILVKIYNLVYHMFGTQNMEDKFIEIIKKYDDYFLPFIEEFTKKNSTSPNHPARIAKEKEMDEKRRLMIIASLQNEGIDVDTTLETDELRKMLQDVIDKKQAAEKAKDTFDKDLANAVVKGFEESVGFPNPDNADEKSTSEVVSVDEFIEKIESSDELTKMEDLQKEVSNEIQNMDLSKMKVPNFKIMAVYESTEEFPNSADPSELYAVKYVTDDKTVVDVYQYDSIENAWIKLDIQASGLDNLLDQLPDTTSEGTGEISEEVDGNTISSYDIYKDMYNCYYRKDDDSDMYTYYDENSEVIEKDIPEDVVLRLMGTNSVTKIPVKS